MLGQAQALHWALGCSAGWWPCWCAVWASSWWACCLGFCSPLPGSVWGPLGLLLGGGLLCALLTLRWPRPLTTLATAVTGAALIATAADYFAELLLLARYAVERLRAAPVPPLCWRSWALLALWPLLSLMGVLVQWRVTAERDSHTEGERVHARVGMTEMGGWVGGSELLWMETEL